MDQSTNPYHDFEASKAALPGLPTVDQVMAAAKFTIDPELLAPTEPERMGIIRRIASSIAKRTILDRNNKLLNLSTMTLPLSEGLTGEQILSTPQAAQGLFTDSVGEIDKEIFAASAALRALYKSKGNSDALSRTQTCNDVDALKAAAQTLTGYDEIHAAHAKLNSADIANRFLKERGLQLVSGKNSSTVERF